MQAPKHLSASSRKLWRRIANDYELEREAHALEVVRLALEALDRCEQAGEAIAKDGAFVVDRFGQKRAHPGLSVTRASRLYVDSAS